MLVGKLFKGNKIYIYEQDVDGGELESFTFLRLRLSEAYYLLQTAHDQNLKLGIENPPFIPSSLMVIEYSTDDDVHKAWKKIVRGHHLLNPSNVKNTSKKYKTTIPGTSCLVRDPKNHIIKIAYRKGDDICSINRMCIDNSMRERFFQDAKAGKYFKQAGKYALDTQDLEVYNYWSKFMNSCYLKQSSQSN